MQMPSSFSHSRKTPFAVRCKDTEAVFNANYNIVIDNSKEER